jgi:hypothetical protein
LNFTVKASNLEKKEGGAKKRQQNDRSKPRLNKMHIMRRETAAESRKSKKLSIMGKKGKKSDVYRLVHLPRCVAHLALRLEEPECHLYLPDSWY